MWTLQIELDASKTKIGSIAVKHGVNLHLHPLFIEKTAEHLVINFTGLFLSNKGEQKAFLKDLAEHERVERLVHKENVFFGTLNEDLAYSFFYDFKIFHTQPWFVNGEKKLHLITMSSWEKKTLMDLVNTLNEYKAVKLLKMFQSNPDVCMVGLNPKLTEKQEMAFTLAKEHGYYEYPRKIELKALAKKANISYSTFQAHLRKAELKLLHNVQIRN